MPYSFDNKTDIYQQLQEQIEHAFSVTDDEGDVSSGLEGKAYRKAYVKAYIEENKDNILVGIGYGLMGIHIFSVVRGLILSFATLNTSHAVGSILSLIIMSLFPFIVWLYSTKVEYWTFHNRKLLTYKLCILNFLLTLSSFIFSLASLFVIPFFSVMQPDEDVSVSMIKNGARLILLLISLLPTTAVFIVLMKSLQTPISQNAVLKVRIDKQFDFRSSKEQEFAYDSSFVKDLKTGETVIVKEKDRFLHSCANGTTGTGKTSSTMTCGINEDLEQISHNLEYQKKECQRLLEKGIIRMKGPMDDENFSIDNFEPVHKKDKDVLEKLKFKAKLAGITAMAPNASFSDEIYELAIAKGLKVNRIDPTLGPDGRLKRGFIGFNPLYINPELDRLHWVIEVNKKAVLFADVAQAIYDASGSSDVYFASLNKNITTTVAVLVCLTYPFMPGNEGKQPTPIQIQEVLNDFDKAKPYLHKMVELYGKRDANGKVNKNHPDLGMFQPIYDVVNSDILGEGRAQLFDQCRGLRNIIDSFLQNPMIRNALCCERTVDLDKCLAEGEITVVNYALELGTDAKAFGLFFLLSFIQAVLRRPGNEKTRIPNFFYIDELPVLLHPQIETCFSLFRQYRTAMFVAIQSLSQMERSKETAFLKHVLLGNCAHHYVFGRGSVEEMKMYEELAGTSLQVQEMVGETSSSLLADNPTVSYNRRSSEQRASNVDGSDIRYREFQEITVVTVRDGSPVAMFPGKVSFLPRYERIKRKRYSVDWNRCYLHTSRLLPDYDTEAGEAEQQEETVPLKSGFTFSAGGTGPDSAPKESSPTAFRKATAQDVYGEELSLDNLLPEDADGMIEERTQDASSDKNAVDESASNQDNQDNQADSEEVLSDQDASDNGILLVEDAPAEQKEDKKSDTEKERKTVSSKQVSGADQYQEIKDPPCEKPEKKNKTGTKKTDSSSKKKKKKDVPEDATNIATTDMSRLSKL